MSAEEAARRSETAERHLAFGIWHLLGQERRLAAASGPLPTAVTVQRHPGAFDAVKHVEMRVDAIGLREACAKASGIAARALGVEGSRLRIWKPRPGTTTAAASAYRYNFESTLLGTPASLQRATAWRVQPMTVKVDRSSSRRFGTTQLAPTPAAPFLVPVSCFPDTNTEDLHLLHGAAAAAFREARRPPSAAGLGFCVQNFTVVGPRTWTLPGTALEATLVDARGTAMDCSVLE